MYFLYLIQIFWKKGGVPTDRRYGYYVKRVEGLPFPTAEAQARLTNNRKRPGLSGHVMPAPASIPSGGTGFEPQSYAHGQVMQGHQQGNLLEGIDNYTKDLHIFLSFYVPCFKIRISILSVTVLYK